MAATMRWSLQNRGDKPPKIKNHSATLVGNRILVFGGFDGRRNHNTVHMFDCSSKSWTEASVDGTLPAGRNGHTATLIDGKTLLIIGGWLGHGPLAADDCHALDVETMTWSTPNLSGALPGPCNMHTADFIPKQRKVFLFRGGNGVEYLNELHTLDVDTMVWSTPVTSGEPPLPRANHGSAVFREELFLFGGWDGMKRLNDVHALNTETCTWTSLKVSGVPPCPRAGMTLSRVGNHIFLFGGSGPSAKCFSDLQIFDPIARRWVDVKRDDDGAGAGSGAAGAGWYAGAGAGRGAGAGHGMPSRGGSWDGGGKDEFDSDVDMALSSKGDVGPGASVGSANPNEEVANASVQLQGLSPRRRAGHTATVVGREVIVFGGSCASEYWNDMYTLDTDPEPTVVVSCDSTLRRLCRSMPKFVNNEEFSDVTFVVEGRPIYAHRVLLSLANDKFRAMFTSGFKEQTQSSIEVLDRPYDVFLALVEHIYTGRSPEFDQFGDESRNFMFAVELLKAADEYMLDRLRQECEKQLVTCVRDDTVAFLTEVADRTNAPQLMSRCAHYTRTHGGGSTDMGDGCGAHSSYKK